jgi:hypothetical protein
MKTLLFVLGLVTFLGFALSFLGIGDSAIRAGVAAILWVATLVAIGTAAICEAIQSAASARAADAEKQRRLLTELLRPQPAKAPAAPAVAPTDFDAAAAVAAMEAIRRK